MSTIQNLRHSLDRNRGLFAVWEGVASLGLSLSLSPPPLPPTSSGDGRALLWSFSVPLFCEPPAVCSGRLIFSLAIPQFKRAPSNCSQGLWASPYPKQGHPLLSVPPPLVGGGCGRLGYFFAGSCFWAHNLWALFNFFSQLDYPLRFKSFPQTRQCEGFLVTGNFFY